MTDITTRTKYKIFKAPKNERIRTALIIGIIVLACLFLGNITTALLFVVISVLGAVELCRMVDGRDLNRYTLIHIALALTPLVVLYLTRNDAVICHIMILLSVFVMSFLIANLWSPSRLDYTLYKYLFTPIYWGLPFALGTFYLLTGSSDAHFVVLGVILLLWTSDTMAYFTGKRFGKHKLFPSVSPGKTIEGTVGGGIFSVILGQIFAFALSYDTLHWLVISLVVWVFGTLGDLVESKLKRSKGVKDSGTLLPGHGGFLDRFDSLVMVIPFLLLLAHLLSIYHGN